MKTLLTHVLRALVLPSLLLVACGDDPTSDMGDMTATGDLSAAACVTVASWPNTTLRAEGIPDPLDGWDFVTSVYADRAGTGNLFDRLGVELYHPTGATTTLPRTVTLSATATYTDCNECLLLVTDGNPSIEGSGTGYFARGGSITVTKADRTPLAGGITVSGSNIHFVEWTFGEDADKPVANGKCVDVGAFSFNATYDNSANDGGTD